MSSNQMKLHEAFYYIVEDFGAQTFTKSDRIPESVILQE